MMRNAKVDSNQPEIVAALRSMGAAVLSVAQVKNAFDILVGYRGMLYMMEIKDGKKPPSQRKLTSGEIKCKTEFEKAGVKYHIVESIWDAVKIIT